MEDDSPVIVGKWHELTPADLFRQFWMTSLFPMVKVSLAILLLVGTIVFIEPRYTFLLAFSGGMLLLILVFVLIYVLIASRTSATAYHRMGRIYSLTGDLLRIEGRNGVSSDVPLTALQKASKNKDLLILVVAPNVFCWIPTDRAFEKPEDVETLTKALRQAGKLT